MSDLYLFAFLLLKTSILNGLAPGIFIAFMVESKYPYLKKIFLVYVAVARKSAFGVPAHNRGERWSV